MILALIIIVTIGILLTFLISIAGAIGAGSIIVFGDVIVCILFLVWILKKIFNRK